MASFPNPSATSRQAEQLAAAGRAPEAILLLNQAGAAGDAEALFTLAMWRMTGRHMPCDLAASRDLFRRAGTAGHGRAGRIHTNLLAAGVGGPVDWPGALRRLEAQAGSGGDGPRQLALIRAMQLAPDGAPQQVPPAEPLSAEPQVSRFSALFTAAECDYLIEAAEPRLQPSMIIEEGSGRRMPDPVRTSDGAAFPWLVLDPAIAALNRRIAAVSGTRTAQAESLLVLRYRPGQQYRPHLDAIAGRGNRRILTVIVYLNDDYAGGETHFPKAGLTVHGRRGDALMFRNVLADGRPDPLSQHAGLPVTHGTKFIASRWIWQDDLVAA
jgi:prolyl 4-hydroxylase